MASKAIWLVILLFICLNFKGNQAFDSNLSEEEELEIERQLKVLNKPPITTFKTKEGDIIDCVDINKQPALDHPLLKNHKVEIEPSTYPVGWSKPTSQSKYNDRESCPIGSVPIRRTLKEDLIRLRSVSSKQPDSTKYYSSNDDAIKFPFNQNVASLALVRNNEIKYYGASANISVYNLTVAQDQSSASNIWIIGGPPQAPNVIMAGWQVNPAVNGDGLTRTFGYWTGDGAKTGCYNMLCPGFVQVDTSTTIHMSISPTSIYEGQQYDYSFAIYQGQKTGNWWLLLGANHTSVGYWPKELFPNLQDGADQVAWGGIAKPSANGNSPPLGNGHFPNGKSNEACYIRTMNYFKGNLEGEFPVKEFTVDFVSNSKCYFLDDNSDCGIREYYYCFTYGGPGGSNCAAN